MNSFIATRAMSIHSLFLILLCGSAFASQEEETKQTKRSIVDTGGWVGIPNPNGYGHGQPWAVDSPWKGLKLPAFDLAPAGLDGGLSYGKASNIPLSVRALPLVITKHIVLEKPVPVPEPVYIEKPYHVPVEKVITVPVEKIIHKPIPIPIPIPEAVPIPVDRAVPIPVQHPVAVPVQQPYPVPVKQAIPVPVPVPVPIPVHSPISFFGPGAVPDAYYARGYGLPAIHPHVFAAEHFLHGIIPGFGHNLGHSFGHDIGHGYGHNIGHAYGHNIGHAYGHNIGHDSDHGHGYAYPPVPYVHNHDHTHDHKKRSKI